MEERRRELERMSKSPAGGREELRSTVLRPYLARLRAERGEATLHNLLVSVGLPTNTLDGDIGWLSVAAACRALEGIEALLGKAALSHWGPWFVHPEVLGAYVRMLRVSETPLDAYQYLAQNANEATRVGNYEVTVFGRGRVQIVYMPRLDVDTEQSHELLCLARRAELASIPLVWGLPEAQVQSIACLAEGERSCKYALRWQTPTRSPKVILGAVGGAFGCGGAVALSGNVPAAAIATVVGGAVGGALGATSAKLHEERAARTFEKHRIAALERGLDLRGQSKTGVNELTNAVLGGKYRILRRVGSGGIGSVYAAEHVALGNEVAVKVLRGAAAADAAEVARLRREAMVQVSLEHPNVVRVLDLDQMPDGSIYVVMELLQGESLAEHLRRVGPMQARRAIPIFLEVCRALEAAHRHGVVHRDLKPGNVFLCTNGSVKVLDFGMSKIASAEKLTEEGYTLGTPEYMSPEQCIGALIDPRSDIYTFGVLMYEALTGDLPFNTRDRRELMHLHQREAPRPMRDRHPDLGLSADVDDIVLACLAKRPEARPHSATELARQLQAALR
jgi:serine/threonine-protein kinase